VTATVRSTEAPPREAPAAATATAWLAAYLHDGPRPSGQLHHDAEQAGFSRYRLYGAYDQSTSC
jgi:predicted methyltransferase